MVLAERYLYFWLFRYIPGLLQSAVTFGLFLFSLTPLVMPQFTCTGKLISALMGFSAQRMISDETSYYLASSYLVILLSLLFFTSLADRLSGFLSRRFPVAFEWGMGHFQWIAADPHYGPAALMQGKVCFQEVPYGETNFCNLFPHRDFFGLCCAVCAVCHRGSPVT